jgi:transposase-like protein
MSKPKPMTVAEFFKIFPDDAACLDHLMLARWGREIECPKCWKKGRFAKLAKVPAYSCPWCGHHVHPMVGTPFENSSTPLQKWFYAMYLFTTSRHGVPAKELQSQLGVTYKTAWRMAHLIRMYMGVVDGNGTMSGQVEADETWVGGKVVGQKNRNVNKSIVFGVVERKGEVITRIVPETKIGTLEPLIYENVEPCTHITTDEYKSYADLRHDFDHATVNHSSKEYVRGDEHTNTIEGFWSIIKRSIRGTHVHVSQQHLAKYVVEFEFGGTCATCRIS